MIFSNKTSSTTPIVAMDMGSSAIRAMAVERVDDDQIRILGVEKSTRPSGVEKGIVSNTSQASFTIVETLRLLGNRIQSGELKKVFVPLGGPSMQVGQLPNQKDKLHKVPAGKHIVEELRKDTKMAYEKMYPKIAVLDLIPVSYALDGVEQPQAPTPEQKASVFHVRYNAFISKKELLDKMEGSFLRNSKDVESYFVRPEALLCALTSEEDWENGCAILDLGAETTTIFAYKQNHYLCTHVVSLGSKDITRDIAQMGIPEDYAEHLKCQYAVAAPEMVETNHTYRIPTDNGTIGIKATDMATVIAKRLDQILAPLMETLHKLEIPIGTLYITGGGAMLQGIDEYIQGMTQIPVMYGSHAHWLCSDTPDELFEPTYSALVGTAILGIAYREENPYQEPKGKLEKKLEELKEQTLKIFTDNN